MLIQKISYTNFHEFFLQDRTPQDGTPSRQLTHIKTDFLAKGLNFSITSKTLPNKDIIATVVGAVKDLEKEEAEVSK